MLYKAAEKYNIDLSKSWMVGDNWRDVECGTQGGAHTCELSGDENHGADMVCKDLLEAVNRIIEE